MITLKTLPQATAQEVFDQITQHLLKQGKAARSGTGACRYRTENSEGVLKCAAGCLIADDEYNRMFEYVAWNDLVNDGKVPSDHCQLIRDFQIIHDSIIPGDWLSSFKDIAARHDLKYNPQPP